MKFQTLIFIFFIVQIFSFSLRQTKEQYFDSYVFALQWPNGYCKINNCESLLNNFENNIMNIHGLWPALKNGGELQACTSGVEIKENNSELFKNMRKYWPSFKGSNVDFWNHEYNKHGYCMVQQNKWDDYEDYFQFVIDLYLKDYKYLIQKAFPINNNRKIINLSYEDLQAAIRKIIPKATFKINCSMGFISEFYFYLETDFTPSKTSKFSNSCKSGRLLFR